MILRGSAFTVAAVAVAGVAAGVFWWRAHQMPWLDSACHDIDAEQDSTDAALGAMIPP